MRAEARGPVVALVVGLLLISYPLVNVPNRAVLVLGIPLLYLYLFLLWLAGVLIAWWLAREREA